MNFCLRHGYFSFSVSHCPDSFYVIHMQGETGVSVVSSSGRAYRWPPCPYNSFKSISSNSCLGSHFCISGNVSSLLSLPQPSSEMCVKHAFPQNFLPHLPSLEQESVSMWNAPIWPGPSTLFSLAPISRGSSYGLWPKEGILDRYYRLGPLWSDFWMLCISEGCCVSACVRCMLALYLTSMCLTASRSGR